MSLGLTFLFSAYGIPGEPERSSHFEKFVAPRVHHRLELFKFPLKAEISKYFCDFSRCLTSTRSKGKVTPLTQNNRQLAIHHSQELQDVGFQTNTIGCLKKLFNV